MRDRDRASPSSASFSGRHGVRRPLRPGALYKSRGSSRCRPAPRFPPRLCRRRHRLEVVGLLAALNLVDLVASILARILGEIAQTLERVAKEAHGFHTAIISKWIYIAMLPVLSAPGLKTEHTVACRGRALSGTFGLTVQWLRWPIAACALVAQRTFPAPLAEPLPQARRPGFAALSDPLWHPHPGPAGCHHAPARPLPRLPQTNPATAVSLPARCDTVEVPIRTFRTSRIRGESNADLSQEAGD